MTYTKLILGTPKFRRRIEYEPVPYINPCIESVVTGEVLGVLGTWEDPSAAANYDGPFKYVANNIPAQAFGWGSNGQNFIQSIAISTANPRNGSSHLRVVYGTNDLEDTIYCGGGVNCAANFSRPVAAICEEGSSITASAWLDRTEVSAGGQVRLTMTLLQQDFTSVGVGGSVNDEIAAPTTGYEELTCNFASAPAGSYWVRLSMDFSGNSTNDVDDITLTLA